MRIAEHGIDLARPNLFIVGAAKSGTTFLHGALSRHQHVVMSHPKELDFFSDEEFLRGSARTIEQYRRAFAVTDRSKVVGEASVSYLFSEGAAERIRHFNPDARIVVSLRNPADVVISLHRLLVFNGHQPEFDLVAALARAAEAPERLTLPWLRYYDAVRFSEQIARYFKVFAREQVRVIFFEDVVRSPEETIADLLSWLGLFGVPALEDVPRNERREPRSPRLARWVGQPSSVARAFAHAIPLQGRRTLARHVKRLNTGPQTQRAVDCETRQSLLVQLAPEVRRLEQLLGRGLSGWLP